MKALSIRQPYAWLIVQGLKDIENRTWWAWHRGPVLIHAGKSYARRDHKDDLAAYGAAGYPERLEDLVGGIVGVASITGCVKSSASPWWIGPYGFTLAGAKACPLVPCVGALGFFDVPDDVLPQLPPDLLRA